MNNTITAEQIEQVLDHAKTLAEKDEYDFPYSIFNTQDMAYIEKAICELIVKEKSKALGIDIDVLKQQK